jgi:hypothetical protein
MFNAVDEYRKRKNTQEQEILPGLDSKIKQNRRLSLTTANNRKLVRTLRFESKGTYSGSDIHTILNIYETPGTNGEQYEAVLKYGDQEGFSSGKYGRTVTFPLGNATAMEYYVAHFKGILVDQGLSLLGFYGATHKFISDTMSKVPSLHASPVLDNKKILNNAPIIGINGTQGAGTPIIGTLPYQNAILNQMPNVGPMLNAQLLERLTKERPASGKR